MAQKAHNSGILSILLIGLLAAAGTFYLSALYFKQGADRAVMSGLAGNVSAFQARLQQIGQRMDLLAAHLQTLDTVTAGNYHPMADTLADRQPRAEILALAQPVPANGFADFLQAAQARYETPLADAVPAPGNVSSTAYRVAFLSPSGLAGAYLARNIASSRPLAEALSRAEASGNIIAGPGWLASGGEATGQWTFFKAVPGKGVLAGLYNISAMARIAMGARTRDDAFSITLFARLGENWQPVYRQGTAPRDEANVGAREFSSDVPLYGTQWRILARAGTSKPLYAFWQAWAIAAIPFLMSLIFTAISPLFKTVAQTAKTSSERQKRPAGKSAAGAGSSSSSSIIGQMVDGIVTIDTEGVIQTANPAALKMFGYDSEEELLGLNVAVLMGEPYRSNHDNYLQRYLKSGKARILGQKREVKARRKSGAEFPMEIAVSEVEVDGQRFFTATMRDITDRKRVDMLKSEFISTVSHELRTPLTSIRGSLGIIINGMAEELPEKVSKLLRVAYQNSERLSALVNDILDMERLDADQVDYTFEPINMNKLAAEAIEANESYAAQYDVKLVAHPFHKPLNISGDFDRMMQLMNNLISNACKFSPKGSTVNIWFDQLDGSVRMTVQDEGDGIAPEFQAKMFERFTQADSSDTRTKGGTGLGLYIVRKIVERHGGRIDFESHQGRGTKFFVELPLIDRAEEDADTAEEASEAEAAAPAPAPTPEKDKPAVADGQAVEKERGSEKAKTETEEEKTEAATPPPPKAAGKTEEAEKAGKTEKAQESKQPAEAREGKEEEKKDTKKGPKVEIVKQESLAAKKAASGKADDQQDGEKGGQKVVKGKAAQALKRRQARQEAKARAAAGKRKKERQRPRILICEDDADIAEFVKTVLTDEGYRVEVTRTAQDAFKRATTEHFDALTVDLILPDRDGISLIRALRRSARASDLEIVVVSRRAKEGIQKLGAGALGIRAWLQKPLKEGELRDAFKGIEAKAAERQNLVLLLDASKTTEENLQQLLSGSAEVERATSIGEARGLMKEDAFHMIVCDPDTLEESLDDILDLAKDANLPIFAYTMANLPEAAEGKFTGIYRKDTSDLEALCEKAFSLLEEKDTGVKKTQAGQPAMTDA